MVRSSCDRAHDGASYAVVVRRSGVKILHLLAWYFPDSLGGTEVYVAELARRQRAGGAQVAVSAPDTSVAVPHSYEWAGVPVFRYPLASAEVDVRGWLTRERPDVVHVHSLSGVLGLAQVRDARRIARCVVFTAHLPALGYTCQRGTLMRWGREPCDGRATSSPCAACWLQAAGVPRHAATMVARIGRAVGPAGARMPWPVGAALAAGRLIDTNRLRQLELFDNIDYFVGLNRQALEIVRANGAPAGQLVLNRLAVGFEPEPKPGPDVAPTGRPVRVGFVGRIHDTKGIRVLIRAFRALDTRVPIRLEIVGPEDESLPEVGEARAAAGRDPRIVMRGPVTPDRVADVLRELDVLCCPSTWYENGPTIALEAQAVGTPVIGTSLGAMPEFITDGVNGRLVPPGDWRRLRDALVEVVADPSIVDGWRRRLSSARTMDDVSRDYDALYERALSNRARPPRVSA